MEAVNRRKRKEEGVWFQSRETKHWHGSVDIGLAARSAKLRENSFCAEGKKDP